MCSVHRADPFVRCSTTRYVRFRILFVRVCTEIYFEVSPQRKTENAMNPAKSTLVQSEQRKCTVAMDYVYTCLHPTLVSLFVVSVHKKQWKMRELGAAVYWKNREIVGRFPVNSTSFCSGEGWQVESGGFTQNKNTRQRILCFS